MASDNLWSRRSNIRDKATLSTKDLDGKDTLKLDSPRAFSNRRPGDTSSSRHNFAPPSATSVKSPGVGASAFGLGTGAFASFGSAKTPKTPGTGTGFDFSTREKEKNGKETDLDKESGIVGDKSTAAKPSQFSPEPSVAAGEHAFKHTWKIYYRPPANKYTDYEKSIIEIATVGSVEAFWTIYTHLKSPSALPTVSDYHIFKENIRPVWEDDSNKKGGKWIIRLKKGVADRYWESLLLATVGDQFMEANEEVCGAVLSVRSGEDVLSVWTRNDGGRNIRIREIIKRVLSLPPDTNIVWRSHDDSIAQRTAADEARQPKSLGPVEKRRVTSSYTADEGKSRTAS